MSKQKIGRNEKCPCGSGKKYKKCCLLKENNNEIIEESEEFSMTRGYGLFEGIDFSKDLGELQNDGNLVMNFRCKNCGKEYDYKVEKLTFDEETGDGKLQKEPICPKCSKEKEWELTFLGQSQATELRMRD